MATPTKDDGYRGIWSYRGSGLCDDPWKFVHYSGAFGTFCAKHIPLAYYAPEVDKTFFCYGGSRKDGKSILITASCYDHNTGTVPRPTIVMDKGTDDAHDNPSLMLDQTGHVWIFASAHGTARPAYIYKSHEPFSVDSFELVQETNFSYGQPWYVEGQGFLFLHTRYLPGRFLYWTTSQGGVEWSEPKLLSKIALGHYQISWRCGTKVGTAFNYHPTDRILNDMKRTNLYYLETEDFGKTWRNVQGEAVNLPLETVGNAALAHDYGSKAVRVYMKDLNFDADGRPVIHYLTSTGAHSGPKNHPRTWTTARWTGREWEVREAMVSDNNYDTGAFHIEPDGTWRIIGPTEVGPQPYNTGGEVAVWTSSDRGAAWAKLRDATKDSPYNHSYIRRPVNAHPDFYAFWADGHGLRQSESRLYFCDRMGEKVFRLPTVMTKDVEELQSISV